MNLSGSLFGGVLILLTCVFVMKRGASDRRKRTTRRRIQGGNKILNFNGINWRSLS